MKYMLMMSGTRATAESEWIYTWPPEDVKAHLAFLEEFNRRLRESGEYVTAQGLGGIDDALIVRAGRDGVPVTDGVFPESKEFLAGYWIVDVESKERAIEIAAAASAAPGRGGVPLNMPIELRQVLGGPPDELP